MHRLIVDIGEPLNASFCEAVLALLGKCEIIPFTENYCVVEGFKMEQSSIAFDKLLHFTEQFVNRAFLASSNGDLDTQLHQLHQSPKNAFICEFEPPEMILFSKRQINEILWCILPWEKITGDDFE